MLRIPLQRWLGIGLGLVCGIWLLVVSPAFAQDQIFDQASGGTMVIGGNLNTDSFTFTHTYSDASQATGMIIAPNLSNYATSGGTATFGNVAVTGNANSSGDVRANSLITPAANFAGLLFQDNNNQVSGTAYLDVLSYSQGNGQLIIGANGQVSLADNATGNSITITPANFTVSLSGHNTGIISLQGSGAAITRYSTPNMTLDFSSAALPYIQMESSLATATLVGNVSAATLDFSEVSGGGVNISPTNQTLSFSNGFILNGNTSTTPFGKQSLVVGDNAAAAGVGAVAIGNASANGILAIALGNSSYASAGGSVALMGGNAFGNNSLALGQNSNTTAANSVALGTGVAAENWGAVVVGNNNTPVNGNATAWAPGDPAFIVGNGTNALTILNNGNITVGGTAIMNNSTKSLQINGPATLNGQANFSGNVILSHALGDISMGNYSN
jgi:hypothetical protein